LSGESLTVLVTAGQRAARRTRQRESVRRKTRQRSKEVAQNKNHLTISFEFFPPKTAEMEATLWRSIQHLAPLDPSFVSVTYGADGSTRDRTHNIVTRILRETR
jgi:5,10-methylenetetrahydrofolate reductase